MRRKLGEILLSSGVVSPSDIAEALSDQSAGEPSRLGDLLVAQGRLTPTQLAQALAEQYGVPFTTLPPLATAVLEAVPQDFQRRHRLVPIRVEGTTLSVAMADLADSDAVDELRKQWPEVKVFAAPGDEIDALHSALSGETPIQRAPQASSPSAEDLFGSLDLDEPEEKPAPPATVSALFGDLDLDPPAASPSALTGALELEDSGANSRHAPSGMFELQVNDSPGASTPSGMFELKVESTADDEVLDLTTGAEVPDEAARATPDTEEGEDDLFFEARPSAPASAPIAPPPVVAPVSPVPAVAPVAPRAAGPSIDDLIAPRPPGEPVPPIQDDTHAPRGPSLLEQLFVGPEDTAEAPSNEAMAGLPAKPSPANPAVADTKNAPRPPGKAAAEKKATEAKVERKPEPGPQARSDRRPEPKGEAQTERRPDAKPERRPEPKADAKLERRPEPGPGAKPEQRSDAKAAARREPKSPAEGQAEAGFALPDWLKSDAAAPTQTLTEETPVDPWTGELETLAPSKLITGVARALIRKGILTEEEVLEALERKKS